MPPPPPPPPPLCFPWSSGSKKRDKSDKDRYHNSSYDEKSYGHDSYRSRSPRRSNSYYSGSSRTRSSITRSNSLSPTNTLTSRGDRDITFHTDSESYNVPSVQTATQSYAPSSARSPAPKPQKKKRLWGYGWGLGKAREREKEKEAQAARKRDRNLSPNTVSPLPLYQTDSNVTISEHPTGILARTKSPEGSMREMGVIPRDMPVLPGQQDPIDTLSPTHTDGTILYDPGLGQRTPPTRTNTGSSGKTFKSGSTVRPPAPPTRSNTQTSRRTPPTRSNTAPPTRSNTRTTSNSKRPGMPQRHTDADSASDTLVGSMLSRKRQDAAEEDAREAARIAARAADTMARLAEFRELMAKDNLDLYVIPSEDAHGSEYVAEGDKRREYISGFTGSAGVAIISRSEAFLVTDSRYWLQAGEELGAGWHLIRAPAPPGAEIEDGYKDWQTFLCTLIPPISIPPASPGAPRSPTPVAARIGIDARTISVNAALALRATVESLHAKLTFPQQNLVDRIWKTRPARSLKPVKIHSNRYAGESAESKLAGVREWIRETRVKKASWQPASASNEPEGHVGTLVASLPNIAWVLNLRGEDIPYNPVFHAYLFISLNSATLFVDLAKLTPEVKSYLDNLGVQYQEYNQVWQFLRSNNWGSGKVLITDTTSYAIALILTSFRYTVASTTGGAATPAGTSSPPPSYDSSPPRSYIDFRKAIKNPTEAQGLRNAHLRDGAAFSRFFAWLEDKLAKGYEVTELEAAQRLKEYRSQMEFYEGLAYETISATGKNAALPHYTPRKGEEYFIERGTPYLNDSGGQYLDGTIDTTRTYHFDRPTPEMCEAYTRVLQGHIAIDSAIFPEGTSGQALDVLARRALWKEGLNYLHGTGHGFGSYLNVHEGPHSFASPIPLVPGNVITNEPGFYNDEQWGIRIESALLVRRVKTPHEYQGPIWLGFERLTCVPIQTKMVKESLLSKEEITWIKEHNKRCREKLEPFLKDDKRALKWLVRQAERGIGVVDHPNMYIDWD